MNERIWLRIAEALERLAPPEAPLPEPDSAAAFAWDGAARQLRPVQTARGGLPLDALAAMDRQKARFMSNLSAFAQGRPANHVLLWGARGAGKSALVRAGAAALAPSGLKLVELPRDRLADLPHLAGRLAGAGWRAAVFLDDLSFAAADPDWKALKSVLDGGVDGAADRVLLCATSNRRHLMARDPGAAGGLRPDETADEEVALAERFGLWLGFAPLSQADWLSVVRANARHLGLDGDDPDLERDALAWAAERGARSGRQARQYLIERAARN